MVSEHASQTGLRAVAIIPARANSKRLPNKNIRALAGTPLIGWTIRAAQRAQGIDHIVVSTDGEEIERVAKFFGVDVIRRPDHLASDTALARDAALHAIDTLEAAGHSFDVMVYLQPTSPLRSSADIEYCLERMATGDVDSVASFSEMSHGGDGYWSLDGEPVPYLPTSAGQAKSTEPAYALNGAVFALSIAAFRRATTPSFVIGRSGALVMPPERSVDIDDASDFALAQAWVLRTGSTAT